MLVVILSGDESETNGVTRNECQSWRIEFEGEITVTDRDGTEYSEHAKQRWIFSDDSGFLVTINFGVESSPRVSLAGNDKTPMAVIGETIASTIRATSTQPETRGGREGS